MRGILLMTTVFLLGCQATMVETRKRVQGPVAEVAWIDVGGGQARYALGRWRWLEQTRRADALQKIADYCGGAGKFKIVDEVDREVNEARYSGEDVEDTVGTGGRHYRKAKYHDVYFECAP